MDYRLLASTFIAIFLAELGDKTQLATLPFASGGQSRLSVFIGSALALVLSSAIAVLGGETISRFVSPLWLKYIAGAVFVGMGALFLLSKPEPKVTSATPVAAAPASAEML